MTTEPAIRPRGPGDEDRGDDASPPPRPPDGPSAPLATLLALWFGAGLLRPAPGTWGSLVAVPLGLGLLAFDPLALWIGAGVVTLVGVWAAAGYQAATGRHDASEVVIDEVAGQWTALLALPIAGAGLSLQAAAAAFVLFRLFDIWKPGPIGWADRRLGGGLGVMVDDVLAGIAAGAVLWALLRWTDLATLGGGMG